jgi:hypothetical protein
MNLHDEAATLEQKASQALEHLGAAFQSDASGNQHVANAHALHSALQAAVSALPTVASIARKVAEVVPQAGVVAEGLTVVENVVEAGRKGGEAVSEGTKDAKPEEAPAESPDDQDGKGSKKKGK